jgi:uncharacterized RmlC-like cupin family protein
VAELTARPEFAPPPHIHHHEDESYYVLNGEFEFMSGGRQFRAGAGSFVYLPRGELHLHRALAGAAKALVLVTPAGVEKFITEAGNAAADPSAVPPVLDMPAIERILSSRAITASRFLRRLRCDDDRHIFSPAKATDNSVL